MRQQEIFLVIIIIVIWLASIRKPFYGVSFFYFYFALMYNNLFESLRFIRPLVVAPLIALFSIIFIQRNKLIYAPPVIIGALILAWMFFSRAANGLSPWKGFEIDSFFKIVIFLFLVTNVINTKERLLFFIWIMVIAYADLSYVARHDDVTAPYFINRNNFGFTLVGAAAFPAMFFVNEIRKLRMAEAVCYFMLIVFSISGTNSRGCYLGLIVVFILITISLIKDLKITKLVMITLPIILVLSMVSTVHWERFSTISVDKEQGGTGGQRLALWSSGLRMLSANPVFGVGAGESGPSFSKYATYEEKRRVGGGHIRESVKPHNSIIQFGAETGIIGLGLFLMIIYLSFRDIWQARKICIQNDKLRHLRYMADALGISLTGLLVAGQFSNSAYDLQFFTILALAHCLKRIILREHQGITSGKPVASEPVIPVKWEVPFRTIMLIVFTYISLRY